MGYPAHFFCLFFTSRIVKFSSELVAQNSKAVPWVVQLLNITWGLIMAVKISDIIVPDVWNPYVEEQFVATAAFIQAGIIQLDARVNATEGGQTVNVPFWKPWTSDAEVMSDNSSLTPEKVSGDRMSAAVLHRAKAFEARDLAGLAAGSDPMQAIGDYTADFLNIQNNKVLINICSGLFGDYGDTDGALSALTVDKSVGSGAAAANFLSATNVTAARALLGDRGRKLRAIAMHSSCYYDLEAARLLTYTNASGVGLQPNQFDPNDPNVVTTFAGLRVIYDDDITKFGTGSQARYACYLFEPGMFLQGTQRDLQTETDRDILAKSDAMSLDWHYVLHPMGCSFSTSVLNPTNAQLATKTNWTRKMQAKNIGIVRLIVNSAYAA